MSTACASGSHALGEALALLRGRRCRAVLAGGSEACVDALSLGAFARMRALSTRHNDRPEQASRPFDRDRDGFVLAEGAGAHGLLSPPGADPAALLPRCYLI